MLRMIDGNLGQQLSCDLSDNQSACSAKSTFSIGHLLVLTAVWAVLFQLQSWQSMIVVSVVLLTWLFGCQRTRKAVQLVVPALYVPGILIWLWAAVYELTSWEHFRHASILPGAFPTLLTSINWDESTAFVIAAIFASTIFLLAVSAIRFFEFIRDGVVVGVVLFSVLSGLASFFVYFRMRG